MSRLPAELKTQRLVLRPPCSSDAKGVLDAVNASYTELNRWMPWAKSTYGEEEAAQFCAEARKSFDEDKDFITLLTLPADGKVIGSAALHCRDEAVPSFEIGYWPHSEHSGHGYVTEAAHALTTFAFNELGSHRVEIRMDEKNHRSWAVAERLGYEWEATLKWGSRDNLGQLAVYRVYAMFNVSQLASLRG